MFYVVLNSVYPRVEIGSVLVMLFWYELHELVDFCRLWWIWDWSEFWGCCECVCAQIVDCHGGLNAGWGPLDKKCLLFFHFLDGTAFVFVFYLVFCFVSVTYACQ